MCFAEGLFDNRVDNFNVATRCDFWYNTSIDFVDIDLTTNDIRKKAVAIFNYGCRGFVATAFNSQYSHLLYCTTLLCYGHYYLLFAENTLNILSTDPAKIQKGGL